ncbi:MAG: Crp/Fnr family transcriptional regulator [Chloroflexi bacterium]|nr:Crp/Fnr family transcriptional regulator [Chloroflexota bacterium]
MVNEANGSYMMVTADSLSTIQLFKALSPRTHRCLAEKAVLAVYPTGVDLYRQGDPPSGLFALQSGRVKLYRRSKEKCQILALPLPGDCLGAESLPTGGLSPYSATTLTPVKAVTLPADVLQTLLDEHADFQEVFLRLITDRLKQFVTLVHDLAFRDVTSRLATVLLARAELEGRPHEAGGVYFDRLLSQQEYADMVGTAREVVYRTFKKFEDDGLVRLTRDTIYILDLDTLRVIALQEAR